MTSVPHTAASESRVPASPLAAGMDIGDILADTADCADQAHRTGGHNRDASRGREALCKALAPGAKPRFFG
jgi:hypothetical protein